MTHLLMHSSTINNLWYLDKNENKENVKLIPKKIRSLFEFPFWPCYPLLCTSCVMREFLEVEKKRICLIRFTIRGFWRNRGCDKRNSTILRRSFKRVARIKADKLVRWDDIFESTMIQEIFLCFHFSDKSLFNSEF